MSLVFDSAGSWDFLAAADVTKVYGVGSGKQWQGSFNSMVAGWDTSGQAIYAPNGFFWPWAAQHTVLHRIRAASAQMTVDQLIVSFRAPGGDTMQLRWNTSGKLYVKNTKSGGATWTSTGTACVVDTFYNLEIAIFSNLTTGSFAVRKNGRWEPGLRKFNVDTKANGAETFDRATYTNADLTIDDYVFYQGTMPWDDADFLTDTNDNPRTFTRYPTADGTLLDSAWAVTPLYAKIDEAIASTADEVTATGSGNRDASFVATAMPSAVMVYARVHNVMCSAGGSSPKVQSILAIDGVAYPHPATAHQPAAFEWYVQQRPWTISPADGLEFTQATVNSSEPGMRAQNGTGVLGTHVAHLCEEILYSTIAATVIPAPEAPLFLLKHLTHHLARCWKILRPSDMVTLYFTDHNAALTLWDGHLYEPASGMDASADRRESELREASHEFSGVISSDRIKSADVRAGRYRSAIVTEYIVDWRYPWGGALKTTTRWWDESSFSKEFWTAQMTGISRFLEHRVGIVATRTCSYDLFDPDTCRKSPVGFTYIFVEITAVIGSDRRVFQGDSGVIPNLGDDFFNSGTVAWTSGQNLGFVSEVRDYITTGRQFELQLPLAFAPSVGDAFTALPGCNKRKGGDCLNKYNNVVNFGGEPYMTSRDRAMQTPTA